MATKFIPNKHPFQLLFNGNLNLRSLVLTLSDISLNDDVLFELYGLFCLFVFSMTKMKKIKCICICHFLWHNYRYKLYTKWTAVVNFISFVDVIIHRESMEFEKETRLSMWDTLPDDIILHIFSFLSPFSVVRMSETCRYSSVFQEFFHLTYWM